MQYLFKVNYTANTVVRKKNSMGWDRTLCPEHGELIGISSSASDEAINFKVFSGMDEVSVDYSTFKGGEEHVRINGHVGVDDVTIVAKLKNSRNIMQLVMLKDALYNMGCKIVDIYMEYIPYARQDRVCNHGEALSIKVFANLINSCNFNKVFVTDPHSDVATALINNVVIIDNSEIIEELSCSYNVIVAPDAGALKKVHSMAKELEITEVITATKIRDTMSGEIVETKVDYSGIEGKHVLIYDDICDGGRTFIELAKVLRKGNPKSIDLCVTHGIFSKGTTVILEHINHIYTTDSWCSWKSDKGLTVL